MEHKELKGRMVAAGVTREELARAMGVNPSTLSRKLNGQTQFTVAEVATIGEVLKIEDPRPYFFNLYSKEGPQKNT